LHSFDLHKVRGGKVLVEMAREGEKLVTLDGQERTLTARDITIRDAEGAIGLGGVMGGGNSEMDDSSTGVMLEGAVFNTASIRYTSKRLSLPSEAAHRNERGVDQNLTGFALERAALMIARLSGGKMSERAVGCEAAPWKSPVITLRRARAELLIGVELAPEFCKETLELLGCKVEAGAAADTWKVTPPSSRRDLEREADLIEEIARLYGYENLPETIPAMPKIMEMASPLEPRHKFWMRVKNWATGLGLNEAVNYSFVGHKDLDHLGVPKEGRISIMNPLSDELDALRTVLAPGLLNTLRNNLAHGNNSQRFFEVASAFTADAQSETTAHENMRLAFLLYGDRFSSAWPQSRPGQAQDADYQDLKGLVEAFLDWLHLGPGEYTLAEQALPWLAPCVELRVDGRFAGTLGRVRPEMAENFHARKDVWLAELDLDALYDLHHADKIRFKKLPAFPPVKRDITVMAPAELKAGEIEAAIRKGAPATLESLQMIDLFTPEGGAERNLTWRLVFRDAEKTLKDAEVDKMRDRIAQYLVKELAVRV
ncbi:phenylalanine--tRNA ligase subunit beta, partial [Desulfovibrio sp. OttesenSCG-928-C14]|nr:phenylalanine--tRNA ligase subunit beta [Desulfovibrio sp. OttesenSCG-928-C14]